MLCEKGLFLKNVSRETLKSKNEEKKKQRIDLPFRRKNGTGIVEKYYPGPGRQQVFRERRLVSTAEQMKAGLRLPAFVWISSQRQTRVPGFGV